VTERENRVLGPEMQAEGWIVIGGESLYWIHPPSNRCINLHDAPRDQCQVPCWGPEPADPNQKGYFVACRVHDELGNPLYGDAFWVESYAVAIKVARKLRAAILAEGPSHKRQNRAEFERRKGEAWAELASLARMNAWIAQEKKP
jgi:hypothetical protein